MTTHIDPLTFSVDVGEDDAGEDDAGEDDDGEDDAGRMILGRMMMEPWRDAGPIRLRPFKEKHAHAHTHTCKCFYLDPNLQRRGTTSKHFGKKD